MKFCQNKYVNSYVMAKKFVSVFMPAVTCINNKKITESIKQITVAYIYIYILLQP